MTTGRSNKTSHYDRNPTATAITDTIKDDIKVLRARVTELENEKAALLSIVVETRLELEADLQRQTDAIRQREMDIAVLGDMLHARDKAAEQEELQLAPSAAQVLDSLRLRRLQVEEALKKFILSITYMEVIVSFTKQADIIGRSPLFDEKWYRHTYPDLSHIKNLKAHFVRFGAFEGRNPSPAFDTMKYYLTYPDVAEAGACALVHYLICGQAEGRTICPVSEPVSC